jgi:NADPH:quinone reductase-like Zn-dependent oxidoreductase
VWRRSGAHGADRRVPGERGPAVTSPAKAALAASLGADHVIDYTRDNFTDGTRRYDVILDTAGRRALHHPRRALAAKVKSEDLGRSGSSSRPAR